MDSKISLQEWERRWKVLLERAPSKSQTNSVDDKNQDGHVNDPFDCSSLVVPPIYDIVDTVASKFVQQWRDLDQRKVVEQPAATAAVGVAVSDTQEDTQNINNKNPNKKARLEAASLPAWYEKRVRFPEQFDFESKQAEPPADDGQGDRVISLKDPTVTTSYHQELWKLFQRIPLADTLEQETVQGVQLPHMLALNQEIDETMVIYPRLDGHALSRMRTSDRHDLVPPNSNNNSSTDLTATIRFECWRRQPHRGATPDAHRVVLEFLGSQTLADFHRVLVELYEDDLWTNAQHTDEENQSDNSDDDASANDKSKSNNRKENQESSGFFFVEGAFYTIGPVDYTGPIQAWLQSGRAAEQTNRATYLGLDAFSQSAAAVQYMARVRLDKMEMRLGMRYHHVCHGNVECSVICTDRRMSPKSNATYPILHDIWVPSYTIQECEACRHGVPVIATSTTCTLTDGNRVLCEACSRRLKLQEKVPADIERFSVWRSQVDLTSDACRENLF
jgi:hypothetical protein